MSGEPGTYPFAGTLRIPVALVGELVEQAQRELPNEACGVAGGRPGEIVTLHPLTNVSRSPERYTVDPAEQMAAYREMDDLGLESVAVYHSHPATPARPSTTDIAEAFDPEAAYVIVSLAGPPVVRAFRIRDGEVAELTIETTDEGARDTPAHRHE